MNNRLTREQVQFYEDEGYLVLEHQIPMNFINDIRDEIARFELEAKGLSESNDRLDLEDSHTPARPRVRRI